MFSTILTIVVVFSVLIMLLAWALHLVKSGIDHSEAVQIARKKALMQVIHDIAIRM